MRRRDFVKLGALGGLGLALRPALTWAAPGKRGLRKFVQGLPGLGSGIPLASNRAGAGDAADSYQIEAAEFRHQFHPDLLPSRVWGYGDVGGTPGYLGGVIFARKDRPVRLRVHNRLPATHPLPVDTSLMGAMDAPNRISVHLHGGFVPWNSDGGPFAWFDAAGNTGDSFAGIGVNGVPAAAEYYYPNQQSARLMWYHDHALGITRLNAYAGLATAYLLTDDVEQSLIAAGYLPDLGIPLVLQDKSFFDGKDPKYVWGQQGDLWYPYRYERKGQGTPRNAKLPVPSCVPEFFGDTAVVNGAAYPYLELQPRHHRFRILNAAQASFYNLQLYYADATGEAPDLNRPGPAMMQIGNEGGFLPRPVVLNAPPQQIGFDAATGNANRYTLLLAPAERADVIIDFGGVAPGSKLILYNDAPGPFPMGTAPTASDVAVLMQFRIVPRTGAADPATLDALRNGTVTLPQPETLQPSTAVRTRNLTLNEDFDEFGRLIQRLGTDVPVGTDAAGQLLFARNYMDDPTETPRPGDVEIWNVFNLTGDTHPIHFHLANVQLLSRQPFDVAAWFAGDGPRFTGIARPPDANERGWKETVRMHPGECASVIMRFDLPSVPFAVPESPRTGGAEYVWHCHILEHEEHDMMRPLVVRKE